MKAMIYICSVLPIKVTNNFSFMQLNNLLSKRLAALSKVIL